MEVVLVVTGNAPAHVEGRSGRIWRRFLVRFAGLFGWINFCQYRH